MGGSEGTPLSLADVGRQAALLKKPLKYGENKRGVLAGGRESLAVKRKRLADQ